MDPYITTGMIRTQCSLPLLTISPNPNQQLTADNGTVDSMRVVLAQLRTAATVTGF